ncbi:MAG: NTP transferase domain-containing protein [Planctomycetota bacterium]|jgi:nitroreductase/CTP:molybdopterin cytidylyltransferase MocA
MRAVVPAAGRGERLGQDKALMDLAGETAIARIAGALAGAGITEITVVRAEGAASLPTGLPIQVAETGPGEMIDSLRCGIRAGTEDDLLFWPVDYPMVSSETIEALLAEHSHRDPDLLLPICMDRPGHPILISQRLLPEILDPNLKSLRDVIRRDRERVAAVPVEDPWIHRDIDRPADLDSAQAYLAGMGKSVTEHMRAHRSCRSYLPDPVDGTQLDWIIDSARHCPTSSFLQAYSILVVRDIETKAAAARLCADQAHIHEAPVFLGICADLHKIALSCERHGASLADDGLEVFLEASIDAALVGQSIQLAAESEGLGACMIGAARRHPVALAELLGLPRHVYVVFGMSLGWPREDGLARGRMPLAAVRFEGRYGQDSELALHLDAANEQMRAWARRINAERGGYGGKPVNEERGWTERVARIWGGKDAGKERAGLQGELRQLGFGLESEKESGS